MVRAGTIVRGLTPPDKALLLTPLLKENLLLGLGHIHDKLDRRWTYILPPLNYALRAFEAAAPASEFQTTWPRIELHVTPLPPVGQQVEKRWEVRLGGSPVSKRAAISSSF